MKYFPALMRLMKRQSLFTRNFSLCTLICFFYTIFFFMFYTGMTSYSEDILCTGSMLGGFVASIFIGGDIISRLAIGGRLDYYGKKRLAIIFLALGTAISLFYFVTDSVAEILVVRFIHGISYGVAASAVNTIVAQSLPAGRRGEGMGYFMLSMTIGSALGPFMCMYLQGSGLYHEIFAIGCIANLAALIVALFLVDDRKGVEVAPPENPGIFERSALPISVVAFVFFFSYSGVLSFISPYGNEIGLHIYAVYFFVALSVGTLICRLFLSRMYDIYGENLALIPMFILFVIGMVLLSTATNGYVLLFSGLLIGFNIAQLNSVGQAVVVREASPARVAAAVTMFGIFLDLAYAVGPILNGGLIDCVGYRTNYLLMAGVGLFSLVLYIVLHGRKHRGTPFR